MRNHVTRFGAAVLAAGLLASFGSAAGVAPDKNAYPVFPDEDKGADPSVPAEKGGAGFGKIAAAQGWTTNVDFDLIGDPRAVKGGEFVTDTDDYPSNFRPVGPQSNTWLNSVAESLMFDSLLALHPETLEFIPNTATHWKKSADGQTFSYRINPNARWADGSPVTSEDVVATYDLLMDETLGEPAARIVFERFHRPVAVSKYIVSVTAAKPYWQNFRYFSSAAIYPAKEIRAHKTAGDWVKAFNQKFMMPSGAYEGRVEDQVEGQSWTLRRRPDYWNANARINVGLNNFDRIKHIVIGDEAMTFERFKKGDLNIFQVSTARRWVQEMVPDKVPEMKRNLIRKLKIFTENPQGIQGLAFNMNKPPYDDVRVRKALTLLLNRKELLEKLMFNQYIPTRSYFSRSPYENPANPRNDFDPRTALELLAEAGWKTRNNQGQLVDAKGEPLTVRILYGNPGFEKHLTMYQDSLKAAGVTATLDLTRPDEQWQRMMEKKFDMVMSGWTGALFPSPDLAYHSKLARIPNNNNITGVADRRIDELCEAYEKLEIEQTDERAKILREMDGILANLYPYALMWDAPYTRVIFWDSFGYPEWGLQRTADGRSLYSSWWHDPEKAKRLEEAKRNPSLVLPPEPSILKYWEKKDDEASLAK